MCGSQEFIQDVKNRFSAFLSRAICKKSRCLSLIPTSSKTGALGWRLPSQRLKNKVLNNLADHCPMKKTMTMRYPMTGICIHIQYICVYMCQGVAVQAGP